MDYLRLNLPGALDGVVEMEIANTLDEFLSKTNAWTAEMPLRVKDNKQNYSVKPAGGSVVRLIGVLDDNPDMDIWVPASMPSLDIIALRNNPGRSATFRAFVALKPSPNKGLEDIPEWIYENHRLPIQHGVIGRMMSHPAKPYSNERLAIYNMRKFHAMTAQVRAEKSQEYLYRGQVWCYPRNFARGTQRS